MAFLTTILTILATALAIAFAVLYYYVKNQYTYWSKRNVPHSKPRFPLGDLSFGSITLAELFVDIYEKHKKEKFFGFWTLHRPCLMVNDPELIKHVLVQDFSHFHDHPGYFNEKDDPLSAHLFSIGGAQWRNLRAKLSPTFTSGKMKNMFPIVADVGERLQKIVDGAGTNGQVFEIKDLIARFSTDVIASCAFGLEVNSLDNPNSVFRTMGKKIFEPTNSVLLRNVLSFFVPDLARLLKLVVTPKEVSKFFMGIVKETMDHREQNSVHRNDFMQLMIQLKNKGFIDDVNRDTDSTDPFTFEQAAAQAFIFFIGGFETSSTTLQFTLYELAKNPKIQNKLREEILENLKKHGGQMTYDGIFDLKYTGMVIDESLRRYPPAGFLNRECAQDYTIPGTDIVVEKGLSVFIPAWGLHSNPEYYPNPEIFDPERFTEEEKAKRHKYVYLPFGEGPRFCIGQRFAFMQMRVALVCLLSKFRIDICSESPKTIKYDPKALVVSPIGGMHLKITRL